MGSKFCKRRFLSGPFFGIRLESGELGLDAAPLGQGTVLRLVLKEEEYSVSLEHLNMPKYVFYLIELGRY